MCGIAGCVAAAGETPDRDALARMAAALRHRGPDDTGIELIGRVGLVHTRLAIVDPTPSGHQPMTDEHRRWWLTYNGEIFNHHELRAGLPPAPWRGDCDSETLLRLLCADGERVVERCNGLFAFAALDVEGQTVGARPRPVRRQAAVLRTPRGDAVVRQRDRGAARRRDPAARGRRAAAPCGVRRVPPGARRMAGGRAQGAARSAGHHRRGRRRGARGVVVRAARHGLARPGPRARESAAGAPGGAARGDPAHRRAAAADGRRPARDHVLGRARLEPDHRVRPRRAARPPRLQRVGQRSAAGRRGAVGREGGDSARRRSAHARPRRRRLAGRLRRDGAAQRAAAGPRELRADGGHRRTGVRRRREGAAQRRGRGRAAGRLRVPQRAARSRPGRRSADRRAAQPPARARAPRGGRRGGAGGHRTRRSSPTPSGCRSTRWAPTRTTAGPGAATRPAC